MLPLVCEQVAGVAVGVGAPHPLFSGPREQPQTFPGGRQAARSGPSLPAGREHFWGLVGAEDTGRGRKMLQALGPFIRQGWFYYPCFARGQ